MNGHFGNYGGQFVPETLMHPLEELASAYETLSMIRRFRPNWIICSTTIRDAPLLCIRPSA